MLLDIAAYAPTHEVDLSKYPADFVVLSFYKMFGFPTGIGALLIRKDSSRILNKVYYGGGSVLQTITQSNDHRYSLHTLFHVDYQNRLLVDLKMVHPTFWELRAFSTDWKLFKKWVGWMQLISIPLQ